MCDSFYFLRLRFISFFMYFFLNIKLSIALIVCDFNVNGLLENVVKVESMGGTNDKLMLV